MSDISPEFFQHAEHIQEYVRLNLSEADTRVYLIDPVLRLLGYVRVGDLRREVPVPATKEFLDYELFADGKAQAIVEAKAMRIPITDQAAAQCVQYAAVLGVRWCIISNGIIWAVYNAHASGPLADKKVAQVKLDGDEVATQEAWDVLSLFSRESLSQASPMTQLLAERVITDELARPDSSAIAALRKAIRARFGERVAPQGIVDAIARIMSRRTAPLASVPEAESPSIIVKAPPQRRRGRPRKDMLANAMGAPDGAANTPRRRTEVLKPDGTRVTLSDLIDAGLIPLDGALEARNQGVTHIGRVRQSGFELGGELYPNPSSAAAAIRDGRATNGWVFWSFQGRPLSELRHELLQNMRAEPQQDLG